MLIDWLTLKLPREHVPQAVYDRAANLNDRVICISPDGELRWQKVGRESIRSDSHQLVVDPTPHFLTLSGSPARVVNGNNVFGKFDIRECAADMIRFASKHLECILPLDGSYLFRPGIELWNCTRADITANYDLDSLSEVKQALLYLGKAEGGRYKVRNTAETQYFNHGSALLSGKAYAKGPHLAYQVKKFQAEATPEQMELANRILRLELKIGHQWWRERSPKAWYEMTADDFQKMHQDYFAHFVGKVEITEMDDLRTNFIEAAKRVGYTEGVGMAAYRTWCQIKAMGLREVEDTMSSPTWSRHRKVMFEAGMTYADFNEQNIVPFRRRTIELGAPVYGWEDIRRAA
ncbi:phage/plasmid replication protein, II/X family [Silvimonas sp.]|uniref:phage/plasmid replication protein, II/X family n=1 Tax=Silvimonas sp. TaxID=2650811 RepID=UPI0028449318|nr:phage/plasmid replication protein, II/X family [Silvimonas sp.]MDR3426917.1 phage/plasmid replication protein, II/X family [Silvimonas sp.]